jgi:predicted ATPase/class 3 adenylate cyclase
MGVFTHSIELKQIVKNLLPHFILRRFEAGEDRGSMDAFAMFVDLSGFTRLTESLMEEGHEGAEKLSHILNDIFSPMVDLVYRRGGIIPYFAGDAFTAIFPIHEPGVNLPLFLHTAMELRDMFAHENAQFGSFQIGIKIGLSKGLVEWGIVGNQQKSYYFRGPAIDQSAQCQTHARHQEIVMDESLRSSLNSAAEWNHHREKGYFLLQEPTGPLPKEQDTPTGELSEAVASHFLPDSVIALNEEGEFRNVISVFCSFSGLDSHELLDRFASVFIDQIHNFSGYFKEVDFGDKGGVLVGFFGAPVSFENNIERALEFVSTTQTELEELQQDSALHFRIGLTYGMAYTGIVGGVARCQYAAVGNHVNLAARLMTHADWGEVLVDEEISKHKGFQFTHKGNIQYKGIEGPVPTFVLKGRAGSIRQVFSGQMVGRETELQQLVDFVLPALEEHRPGILSVFGEAGIGKSRLLYEMRRKLNSRVGHAWLTCMTDQILRKPFNPFIYCLNNYFDQSVERSVEYNQQRFEERFSRLIARVTYTNHPESATIRRELERTRSVFAILLGLPTADSFWQELDAKGRYQNTVIAITQLFLAESTIQPTVLEIEDGHWMDEDSRVLLEKLVARLQAFPIVVIFTSRYTDDGIKPVLLRPSQIPTDKVAQLEVDLNVLQPASLVTYTENRLGGAITEAFKELLLRTTNGNPFYLEQLLEYFAESDLLDEQEGIWHVKDSHIRMSNSIQSLLMARIDRLSGELKETVKAAAVIGREFEVPVLAEVMAQQEALSGSGSPSLVLKEQIRTAEKSQIWRAMNELRYMFQHSLLREAVYDMQLRARLRELHLLIAEAIERIYAKEIDAHAVDLAFHFEQAEVSEKAIHYLQMAAKIARNNYQNIQGLGFYDRLLRLLEDHPDEKLRVKALLDKGQILEHIGQLDECRNTLEEALLLAQEQSSEVYLGRANLSLGHVLVLQGKYREARLYLENAAEFFERIDDHFGIAKVYGDLGNLFFRQGRYEEAKSNFTRSIQLSKSLPYSTSNTQIVAYLGLTHMNQGNYDEGIRWQQDQLELSRRENDKQGMATLYTNMGIVFFEKGDYDAAQQSYEQGLALAEELGNKLLTSIAIGCLGSVYEKKGDFETAMEHFRQDLKLTEEMGEKQGIAIALSLIGELLSISGKFEEAIDYLERTRQMSEELGYQKGRAKSVNTLGDIYYFMGDYEKALVYYDRAIQVTRQINNKLVLGGSLFEKGLTLLKMGRLQAAREAYAEALQLARELGNPDLLFDVQLLELRIYHEEGAIDKLTAPLEALLAEAEEVSQRAELHYIAYRVFGRKEDREKAQAYFERLYAATPKYVYQKRLEALARNN